MRAILLDYEARSADAARRSRTTATCASRSCASSALLRALDAEPRNGRWRFYWQLERRAWALGQTPLRAPTVFNFFEPGYALPGRDRRRPGWSRRSSRSPPRRRSSAPPTSISRCSAAAAPTTGQLTLDLRRSCRRRSPNDEALLDRVDLLFFAGAMSDGDARHPARRPRRSRLPAPRATSACCTLLWLASLAPESVVQK